MVFKVTTNRYWPQRESILEMLTFNWVSEFILNLLKNRIFLVHPQTKYFSNRLQYHIPWFFFFSFPFNIYFLSITGIMHLLTSHHFGVWDFLVRSPYVNSKDKLRRHANDWQKGRFTQPPTQRKKMDRRVIVDHHYAIGHMCSDSINEERLKLPDNAGRNSWKVGRRVIEYDCLFSGLKFCQSCLLGPVPITYDSVVGELKEGLGGYLYVL